MKKLLSVVVIALALTTAPSKLTAQDQCAYWNSQYNIHQQLYEMFTVACYMFGQEYCDYADQDLRAMGNAGNMLDYLGCN